MSHRLAARRAALLLSLFVIGARVAAPNRQTLAAPQPAAPQPAASLESRAFQDLRWGNVGPTRGGRVTAIAGVCTQPCTHYMGATGGGVWKTETCGADWTPISGGQIETGSIGSIDVAESNPRCLGRHRQRRDPQQRDHRPRRLQVGRCRTNLAVHGPQGRRSDQLGNIARADAIEAELGGLAPR